MIDDSLELLGSKYKGVAAGKQNIADFRMLFNVLRNLRIVLRNFL